jgi:uncharacterized membrane protein YphA (DoxX/SURF4 family)
MKQIRTTYPVLALLTLVLLALWIPVGMEKLWDLEKFRRTLVQQPVPSYTVGVLYWAIPVLELLCAGLLVMGWIKMRNAGRWLRLGMGLSSLLMAGFTVFIALGVLDVYEKRPCGCGSVLRGMSWEDHLWFNGVFLVLSVWGWWLARGQRSDMGRGMGWRDSDMRDEGQMAAMAGFEVVRGRNGDKGKSGWMWSVNFHNCLNNNWFKCWYRRKFALFPGRPEGH